MSSAYHRSSSDKFVYSKIKRFLTLILLNEITIFQFISHCTLNGYYFPLYINVFYYIVLTKLLKQNLAIVKSEKSKLFLMPIICYHSFLIIYQ